MHGEKTSEVKAIFQMGSGACSICVIVHAFFRVTGKRRRCLLRKIFMTVAAVETMACAGYLLSRRLDIQKSDEFGVPVGIIIIYKFSKI